MKFLVAFPFCSFSSGLFLKKVSNLCFTGPNCSGHSLESRVRAAVCRHKVSGGCALSERQHCGGISPPCRHTAAVREHKRSAQQRYFGQIIIRIISITVREACSDIQREFLVLTVWLLHRAKGQASLKKSPALFLFFG